MSQPDTCRDNPEFAGRWTAQDFYAMGEALAVTSRPRQRELTTKKKARRVSVPQATESLMPSSILAVEPTTRNTDEHFDLLTREAEFWLRALTRGIAARTLAIDRVRDAVQSGDHSRLSAACDGCWRLGLMEKATDA